ncbi:alpha/beta hydrolase [Streptomyces sp. NPDC058653]|uniref:alpha/beta hydrolase n=1 Tax=Streptomyces sp. NPDC058653 TaxID=3346576 RepID=UPI00365AAFAC
MRFAMTTVGTALNSLSYVSPGLAGKAAFRLFRNPRGRSRLRPEQRPVMDRAEVGGIAIGGERAVSYRWGTGRRPVLLVHGWESRGARFAPMVTELLDLGLSPVAFDAPGHGDATGERMTVVDLRDIIKALDAEHGPFEMVVAHSLGVTATCLALRGGDLRTERIVAISGVPEFAFLVDRFCALLGLRARLNVELRSRIERELFPGEGDIWARFSVPRTAAEAGPQAVLVVHDEDDEMIDPVHSRTLAEVLGDRAELVVTRGLGHRRILDAPQVVATVRDFVVRERERHQEREQERGTVRERSARATARPDRSPQPAAG